MSEFILENAKALGPVLALLVGMPIVAVVFLWRDNISLRKKIDGQFEQLLKVIEQNTNSTNTLKEVLEELKRRQG